MALSEARKAKYRQAEEKAKAYDASVASFREQQSEKALQKAAAERAAEETRRQKAVSRLKAGSRSGFLPLSPTGADLLRQAAEQRAREQAESVQSITAKRDAAALEAKKAQATMQAIQAGGWLPGSGTAEKATSAMETLSRAQREQGRQTARLNERAAQAQAEAQFLRMQSLDDAETLQSRRDAAGLAKLRAQARATAMMANPMAADMEEYAALRSRADRAGAVESQAKSDLALRRSVNANEREEAAVRALVQAAPAGGAAQPDYGSARTQEQRRAAATVRALLDEQVAVRRTDAGDAEGVWNATRLGFLNEEEKNAVLAYAAAGRWDEASELLGNLERILDARQQGKNSAVIAKGARDNPLAGTLLNVVGTYTQPLAYLEGLKQTIHNTITGEDEPINQNSFLMSGAHLVQDTGQGVVQGVNDFFGTDVSFFTETGLSILQNIVRYPLGAASLPLMAVGAAGGSTLEGAQQGLSAGEAVALGTAAGLAEYITEKVSLEKLLDTIRAGATPLRETLFNIGKQVLAEGSEEAASEYLNLIADALIRGDRNEMMQYSRDLQAQGFSKSEADAMAITQYMVEAPALSALGGALSGGVMGGLGTAIGHVRGKMAQNQSTGQQNAASTGETAGLTPYSAQEIENLSSGKRNRILRAGESIVGFVRNALQNRSSNERLYLGRVPASTVQKIAEVSGIDTKNFNVILPSDAVRHAFKGHADVKAEAAQGQVALTEEAMEYLPEVIAAPDRIRVSEKKDANGRIALIFEKNIGDTVVSVQGVSQGQKALVFDTMYIKKEKSPTTTAATSHGDNVQNGSGQTSLATPIIADGTAGGNTQFAQTEEGYTQEQRRLAQAAGTFGENGAKAVQAAYQAGAGAPLDAFYAGFAVYYEAGVMGKDQSKVNSPYAGALNEAQKHAAYAAGQNDAKASLEREKRATGFAQSAGSESGLVYDDYVDEALDRETAERVNRAAKALGVRVRFVDSVRGGTANAKITGSEVLVEKGNQNPVLFVIGHELTHRMQELAPEAYRAFREHVADQDTAHVMQEQYMDKGVRLSYEEALDEAAANYAGRMIEDGKVLDEFIEKHREDKTLLEKVRDAIRAIIAKLTGAERRMARSAEGKLTAALEAAAEQAGKLGENKTAATEDGGVRYSLNEKFAEQLDAWDGKRDQTFRVGTTSEALQGIGVEDRNIIWHSRKIAKILRSHAGMTMEIIKQVPQVMEHPIAVLKSQNSESRIVLFGEITDRNGAPVTVILELQPTNKGGRLLDMNVVASAYGKDSNPARFVENSDLLYLDPNKNRTERWMQGLGLQLPSGTTTFDSIGTISYQDGIVKIDGVPYKQYMQSGENKTAATEEGGVRYSIDPEFARNIEEWNTDGQPGGERFTLGSTGEVLQGLGAIESDIYMESDKISTILKDHPEMTLEEIKRIPELLDDPVLILKSKGTGKRGNNSRLVVFGTIKAQNGQPIMAVLDLRPRAGGFVLDNMQKVNSAYTKNNAAGFVASSEVMHADKKRTIPLLRQFGLTITSRQLLQNGSMGSISYDGQNVNLSGVPFSEVVSVEDGGGKLSLKGSENADEIAALRKENERLQRQVKHYRGKAWRGDGSSDTLMQKDVDTLARKLLKRYDSKLKVTDISGELMELGELILRGGEGLSWQGVKAKTLETARRIVESAVVKDDEMYRQYSGLRQYLRETRIRVPEAIHADLASAGGYGAFRKANAGRLNLSTKDGMSIDTAFHELAETYPEWFSEADTNNPADMLMRMAEVRDGLRIVYENPYSFDLAAAEEHAANDILDALTSREVRQVPATQEGWAAAVKYVQRERERTAKAAQALRDHYSELHRQQAAHRTDSEARTRLLKIVRRLQNKKLPAANRALLNQYIGDIDAASKELTGKTIMELASLKSWYESKFDPNSRNYDPDFLHDDAIERDIARLSQKHINDLTADEVADLTNVLLHIEHELNTSKKLLDSEEKRDVYRLGAETARNIRASGGSKAAGLGAAIDKYILTETLSPVRQLRRMTGYVESDPLYRATQALADGQRKMLDYQMQAERPFREFAADKAFNRRFSGAKAETIKITGWGESGPVEVEITPAMRASLYLHSLNDQNLRHIKEGGITVPNAALYRKGKLAEAYARGVTIKLSPSQVRSIAAGMTDQERAFARAVHRYFNQTSKTAINETSAILKGYELAQVENYFPINTNTNFTKAEFGALKKDGTIEGVGWAKDRVDRAHNPIMLRDVNAVLDQSIQSHSKYVGLAVPVRNFNKIWNVTLGTFESQTGQGGLDGDAEMHYAFGKESEREGGLQHGGKEAGQAGESGEGYDTEGTNGSLLWNEAARPNARKTEENRRFRARNESEGKEIKQVGETTYAYRDVPAAAASGNASAIYREFEQLGIQAFIHEGWIEANRDGMTTESHGQASTLRDGSVGILNGTDSPAKIVAGHEMYHVAERQRRAVGRKFRQVLSDNLDFSNQTVKEYIDFIATRYIGENYDISRDWGFILEELAGAISGDLYDGTRDMAGMFLNEQKVRDAWQAMRDTFGVGEGSYGKPVIYMEEVVENGAGTEGTQDQMERGVEMRPMQELYRRNSDLQGISEGDTKRSDVREGGSQQALSGGQRNPVRAGGVSNEMRDGVFHYTDSVKQAAEQMWGTTGSGYVEKMMTDLQAGHAPTKAWSKALAKIRSNYAGAVLTLNASVAMKQAASYPTAAAVLGWKPLMRAMGDVGKVNLELIEKYTPLQWYRSKGFSTKELGDIQSAAKSNAALLNWMRGKDLPKLLNWVQGMDLLTTRKLWKASEYYVREHNRNLGRGTDAYYRAVAEVYNRVIEETQPNYTTMQRPQLLRSDDSLMANLAMFKTQPFQNFNILYDAAGNLAAKMRQARNGGEAEQAAVKAARRDFGLAASSQLVQLAVFAGMTAAWAFFRGRRRKYENEEGEVTPASFLTAMGKDMAGGLAASVPFGSDAWEAVSSKVFGDTYYGLDAVTITAITDTISSLGGLCDLVRDTFAAVKDGGEVNWNSTRIKLDGYLDDISKALGVPYENVANLFHAAYRQACVAALGKYRGEYRAMQMTTDPEKYSRDYFDLLYKAMKESPADYEEIYADMVERGMFDTENSSTEARIKAAMEKRMKDDQGVKKVSELESRYLSPEETREYDGLYEQVSGSNLWGQASTEQQAALETALYNLVTESKAGERMREKIDDGAAYGIDERDYLLFQLALSMADQPTEKGKMGTYTGDEVEEAIQMLTGLSKREKGYLWTAQGGSEKSNPWG